MDASNDASQTHDTDTAPPFPFCLGWEGVIFALPWLGWIGVTTWIAGGIVPWWAAFPIGLILGTVLWFVTGVINGGSTLVEMTVGATIGLILVAILVPVFAQARQKARDRMCRDHLRQMGLALRSYAQDHDDRLPAAADWEKAIASYLKPVGTDNPYHCPESARAHSYAFDPALSRVRLSTLPDDRPLLRDADGRHRDGFNRVQVDGTVKRAVLPLSPARPAPRLGF